MLKLNFTSNIVKLTVINSQLIVLIIFKVFKCIILLTPQLYKVKVWTLIRKINKIVEKNIPTRILSKSKQKLNSSLLLLTFLRYTKVY